MEKSIKERKECGAFLCPRPQGPTPCLSFTSVPFSYHPHSVVCMIGFVFSPFFLPFLSSSFLAFKIMKLCCGPCPCFSFSCSPWGCVGEMEGGPPNIYQPNSHMSLPLLLGNKTTATNGVMNMNSIGELAEVFFFLLYSVLKFNGIMCLVHIRRKDLPSKNGFF